jgi:hypothetical protein
MEKAAIKDLMYGGIEEILRNKQYYYHSSVGTQYSRFTKEGEEAILIYTSMLAWRIRAAEEADLERRAKEQTLAALKS